MSTNPSQLFLLADHIKLSLLERQRAVALNLDQSSQDSQTSRSLSQLQSGIEALERQLQQSEDGNLRQSLSSLQSQHTSLSTQFHGDAPSTHETRQPNTPSLSADFKHAQHTPASGPAPPPSSKRGISSLKRLPSTDSPLTTKSVRFHASPSPPAPPFHSAATSGLFPYRDDPSALTPPDAPTLSNQQLHTYHSTVLRDQDEQLDRLGSSIRTQRELSMQIGDELDGQALLLDDVDEGVDRHQGQLDRARGRLDRFGRKARESWGMGLIVTLIIILVLLIVILK